MNPPTILQLLAIAGLIAGTALLVGMLLERRDPKRKP